MVPALSRPRLLQGVQAVASRPARDARRQGDSRSRNGPPGAGETGELKSSVRLLILQQRFSHGGGAMNGAISKAAVRCEINVTPLVDVCLVLLIVFMVITPIVCGKTFVSLPETRNPGTIKETGR